MAFHHEQLSDRRAMVHLLVRLERVTAPDSAAQQAELERRQRALCDYIAGMIFDDAYEPERWMYSRYGLHDHMDLVSRERFVSANPDL